MTKAKTSLLAIALLAAVWAPAGSMAADRIPVDLQFYGFDSGDEPPMKRGGGGGVVYRAFGKVVGPRKCARDRKVTLYFRPDVGKPRKVRSGYSDTLGYWSIHIAKSDFLDGAYFAKTPAKKVGKTVCRPDRSNTRVF